MNPARARSTAALLLGALMLIGAAATPRAARADAGNVGTTVAGFLAVAPGAATSGMAGTSLALNGDLAAAALNPAGLGMLPGFSFALSHSMLPDGSRHEWASAGGKLGMLGTRWALSGLYVGQGEFEGRDALNQPTGTFSASSFAGGLALAQPVGRLASIGVGAKFVGENLGLVTGSGVAFDAGLSARLGMLSLGASAQNVGGSISYGGVSYKFPLNYGAGLAIEHSSGLRIAADMNFPYDYYSDVRAGIEYRWHDRFALRGGYRRELGGDAATEPLNGPSFGLGAGLRGVWLDYAYLPATTGDTEQRLGITLVPGRMSPGGAFEEKAKP